MVSHLLFGKKRSDVQNCEVYRQRPPKISRNLHQISSSECQPWGDISKLTSCRYIYYQSAFLHHWHCNIIITIKTTKIIIIVSTEKHLFKICFPFFTSVFLSAANWRMRQIWIDHLLAATSVLDLCLGRFSLLKQGLTQVEIWKSPESNQDLITVLTWRDLL